MIGALATPTLADMVKFDGVTAQGGPTAQVFPVFVAQEKGFYADEGLDDLNYSKGRRRRSPTRCRQRRRGIFSPPPP
jgi:NitT/TauT family transport system substrate-binding protein